MSTHTTENHELWRTVVINSILALAGRVSKATKGISLNFDGEVIAIFVYVDRPLCEAEIDEMRDAEAELISSHIYKSDLVISVVPEGERIADRVGSWGWLFLRDDS